MKKLITEEHVEENVLDILKNLDYDIIRGSNEEYLPSSDNTKSHKLPKTEATTPNRTERYIN